MREWPRWLRWGAVLPAAFLGEYLFVQAAVLTVWLIPESAHWLRGAVGLLTYAAIALFVACAAAAAPSAKRVTAGVLSLARVGIYFLVVAWISGQINSTPAIWHGFLVHTALILLAVMLANVVIFLLERREATSYSRTP